MGNPIRRVIVLGHSGFIGASLVREFSGAPGISEVCGVSDPDLDLTDPACKKTLAASFDKETAVIICAAVKRQFGDNSEAYRKNVSIVENVIEAIVDRPVARVAFMSSAAVYGEETHNISIRESTSVNPTSYYGIAKFTGECLLRKAFAASDSPSLVCFRPPLIYGPGDRARTYGPSGFSAAIVDGSPITLWGDGTELREFLYIDDLCKILRHVTLSEFSGVVNIVSGVSHRFIDAVNILQSMSSKHLVVNHKERSKTKVDNAFDPQLVSSILPSGFHFTSLSEGLNKTLESLA
jgi:UDP-glucose 4-epimerase